MRNRLVPRLRFKNFKTNWQNTKIGKILKIKNGKSQKKVESKNGKYPILATSGEIGRTDSYLYNGESVLIGRKGTIDKPMYFKGHFWTVDTLFYSHIFDSSDGKFIFNLFKTINWIKYNTSSGIPSLTSNNIESIVINAPSLIEQQKIGQFLSKLDRLIDLQSQKLSHLKQLKKGYLQKMFPQKGESVPRLRFDGFKDEWNKNNLKHLGTVKSGGDVKKSNILKSGKYPVVANNLSNNGIIGYYNHFYKVDYPSVTITARGSLGVAKARNYKYTPVVRLLFFKTWLNIYFTELALNIKHFFNESTGVPQLTSPQLKTYSIQYPSIPEQNKISQFFKYLNMSIVQQEDKLIQLKQLKKAYLQKMFI